MNEDEADAQLLKAIFDHAVAYEMNLEDHFLSEYAVIASWTPAEESGETSYTIGYHKNDVPNHIAKGLFSVALDIVSIKWVGGGE
jgi:hypothetical protein